MAQDKQDNGVVIPPASAEAKEDFTALIRSYRMPTTRSVQLEIRKLVDIYRSWDLVDRFLWSSALNDFRGADL